MLTLYIADVERDAGMKKLSREEAAKVLEGMKVKIEIPKAAVTQWERNAALDMAIEVLNCSEIPNKSDTISRQAAIDCVTYDVEHTIECLKALPSAQPDIIRCKDCKYWREHKYAKETKRYIPFCGFSAIYTEADDYCSKAERRRGGDNT